MGMGKAVEAGERCTEDVAKNIPWTKKVFRKCPGSWAGLELKMKGWGFLSSFVLKGSNEENQYVGDLDREFRCPA